jgi:hypothetical protein
MEVVSATVLQSITYWTFDLILTSVLSIVFANWNNAQIQGDFTFKGIYAVHVRKGELSSKSIWGMIRLIWKQPEVLLHKIDFIVLKRNLESKALGNRVICLEVKVAGQIWKLSLMLFAMGCLGNTLLNTTLQLLYVILKGLEVSYSLEIYHKNILGRCLCTYIGDAREPERLDGP